MTKLARNERGLLFDPGPKPRRPRWRGGKAIMVLLSGPCPRCAFPTGSRATVQAPLFYHGGYGEARRDSVSYCLCCGWVGRFVSAAVNPRLRPVGPAETAKPTPAGR